MFSSNSPFHVRPIAVAALSFAATFAYATPLAIDLPAQSLAVSIQQLSRQSGLSIGGDASLLEGKTAPAVKGDLEPADALRKLLEGSGLNVSFEGSKAVIGKGAPILKEVVVAGDAIGVPKEGSAAVGYKPETAKTTGPWGDRPILDTPYSVHVTSDELMENMVSGTSDQVIKFNPLVQQIYTNETNAFTYTYIRGFNQTGIAIDGVPIRNSFLTNDISGIERMEVLSGFSGFLYGAGNMAGVLNLVTKRPTTTPIADVTVGNYGGSQYFGQVDLGGPIVKEGKFGYRLNALHSEGNTPVDLDLKRSVINAVVDWKVTDSFKASLNIGHTDYKRTGTGGLGVSIPADAPVPSASDFDNTKPLTPNWGVNHLVADRVGGNIHWDIDDKTTLRAAALYRKENREASRTPSGLVINANGTYSFTAFDDIGPLTKEKGGSIYLDRKFDTFGIQHKITLGANVSEWKRFNSPDSRNTFNSGPQPTIEDIRNVPEPNFGPLGLLPEALISEDRNTNILIGDDITINQYFSLLVGANRSTIKTSSYNNATGNRTASYDKSATTPTVSLIFKPISNTSLYATYLEHLSQGSIVSETANPPYTNAGQVFEPIISKQAEVGAKANVGGTLLTLAFFRIDRANNYNVDNHDGTQTFTRDGRQVHKGIELTATGKVTDNLTVMGGGYYLDATTTKTNNTAILGKRGIGVAKARLALRGEYRVPYFQTLFLTGGVSYVGSSYLDAANTRIIPSQTFGDVGLRYETEINNTPMILRFNVQNVTDSHYWQYSAGGLLLGAPRTFTFSTTVKF